MKKLLLILLLFLASPAFAQTIDPSTCSISGGTINCPNGSLTPGTGSGTVTNVSVTTANGVSGVVANPTTTPAITISLSNITPSSISTAGQITSTLAIGTAPFVITSTTLVPNLYVQRSVLADSATTNANLTGPITSVGNATSIASQTGTGTKFVVDTSPTLITPNIGAATGTSLALNGATPGPDVLAWSGTATGSGQLNAASFSPTSSTVPTNGMFLVAANVLAWSTNGTARLGLSASFLQAQVVGTGVALNITSGASSTVPTLIPNRADTTTGIGAQATGNMSVIVGGAENTRFVSTGLNVILATDASSTATGALQVAGGAVVAKRFWIPAITASSGLQTAVLCQSSGGEMIADSVACLASSARFKNIRGSLSSNVVDKFMKLPIKIWAYKPEGIFKKGNWTRDRIGPIAEDVEQLDPRLVEYDKDGQVRAYSTEQLLAYTIKVVQEQQIEITALKERFH